MLSDAKEEFIERMNAYLRYYDSTKNHANSVKLYLIRRITTLIALADKLEDEHMISYPDYLEIKNEGERILIYACGDNNAKED